jgi:methylenetetrahydrofolate reductase (NADPH)
MPDATIMNAKSPILPATTATMDNPVGAYLAKASIEITAKQIDKLPFLQQSFRPGTRVFVALIDAGDRAGQIDAVRALHQAGFSPVPHIPARFIVDEDDLRMRLDAFCGEGHVQDVLVLGGGAPQPIGKFDATLQLLQTGAFANRGLKRIGIAGHPEGNPDITKKHGEAMLLQTLKEKAAWIKANGFEGFIATQFLFEAGPLAHWASGLRDAGIELTINPGVPGPATIKTLVKYAAMCGVGNSARFVRKQAMNVTRLLSVSAPDEFADQLATLHFDKPELHIGTPHLYPFGGFEKLSTWLASKV